MAKPPLGSGERFAQLVAELRKEGHSQESAERIAASIGRKRWGAARMQRMAKRGAARKG